MDIPNVIRSELSKQVLVYGQSVDIRIFRLEREHAWTLKLVAEDGSSLSWADTFENDQDAFNLAKRTLTEEGLSTFNPDNIDNNIIPFPTDQET